MNFLSPHRQRVTPPLGAQINYGHPLARGIIACHLPGNEGISRCSNLANPADTLSAVGTLTQTQTRLGVGIKSASGGNFELAAGGHLAPLPLASSIGDGAFSVLLGVRLGATAQSKYVYYNGNGGSQIAVIYGFSSGNFELFTAGAIGGDFRTSSQIGVSDLNLHLVGYTYSGRGGQIYKRWLDGVDTTIATNRSLNCSNSWTQTDLLSSNSTADRVNASFSFVYVWSGVQDFRWLQADPFAFLSPRRVQTIFVPGVAAGGGSAAGLFSQGMEGGIHPLYLGGCNG